MRRFESIGQYHDLWSYIVLSAPDRFSSWDSKPAGQLKLLREAFDDLRRGFYFAEKKLKDERLARIARELIEMSFEAYASGDAKVGAHALQESEGLIWKGRSWLKPKHAVEAERRAFGENVTYAGVKVSPYPYEGSSKDLGEDQVALLQLAQHWYGHYQADRRDVKAFVWVRSNHGVINRISPDPKEDDCPVLPPPQKSFRAINDRLKELANTGQIRACVLVHSVGTLVSYELEQSGRSRVSARQLFGYNDDGSRYSNEMRFHLEDPQFFLEQA